MSDFSTQERNCMRCSRSFTPSSLSTTATTTATTFFCEYCRSRTPPPYNNTRPTPAAASFITTLKKDKHFVLRNVLKQMDSASSCAICLDEFKLKESVNQLSCHHWFHHDCIRKWLDMKNSCPMCRREFPRERDHHHEPQPPGRVVQYYEPVILIPTVAATNSRPSIMHRRTARIQAGAMLPYRRPVR